ncbi:MAG TPA: PaaI family thioesterase [Burkholderiales bacterium]
MKYEGKIEFCVIEHQPDRVVSEMPIQPGVLNPFGVVHAGAILWFADVTATHLAKGPGEIQPGMPGFPLAISLNAHLAGNQKDGKFRAVSTFVKKGKTLSVVRTTVLGEHDRLVADVTTTHIPSR